MSYAKKVQIGDCTLYLGDCQDILPTIEHVDAVVACCDAVVYTDEHGKPTKWKPETPARRSVDMGGPQSGDTNPLRQRGDVTEATSKSLRDVTAGSVEGFGSNGDQDQVKGQSRKEKREIHRRDAKHSVPKDGGKDSLQQVRVHGPIACASCGRSSHEQRGRKFGSSLLSLPYKSPQTGMVGQEKISILTDPPYGIGIDGQKESIKGKKSDRKGFAFKGWDNKTPESTVFDLMFSVSDEQIIWGGNYFQDKINKVGRGWLLWDKDQHGLTMSDGEIAYSSLDMPFRIFKKNRSVLKKDGTQHPTQKPIELMKWCLDFLPESHAILDPFMGSGTTGVACAKMGRKFIGIELDPDYFEIACERIRKAYDQPDLFVAAPAQKHEQESMI